MKYIIDPNQMKGLMINPKGNEIIPNNIYLQQHGQS